MISIRRSIRVYDSQGVPDEVLDSIVEAAIHAPSPHNTQPWRFVTFRAPGLKHRLALAMGRKMEADMRREGEATADIEKRKSRSYQRITQAPQIIIACLDQDRIRVFSSGKRMWGERVMAMQSLAASLQNLLLAAESKGLAASWMAAPLYCPATVRKVLGLPKSLTPQALVTLGYGRTRPKRPPKLALDQILYRI
jgi:F420 biosynthesis protein FbiB-like protein